jgi:Zn-dependent protease with chaperone function
MLIGAGLFAAGFTFAINWLALIPWRRAKDRHWTERARLYYPVLVAAKMNLWVLPAILTMSALLLWPDESPHWMLMVLATAIGTTAGTVPMDHEVFPRTPLNEILRLTVVGWLIRFATWFVFLSAIALSPDQFNSQSLIIFVAVLALLILWNRRGWVWAGQKFGLFLPPPERLQNIVRDIGAGMNVPVRELWLMHSVRAQAYAMPESRRLVFTDRLLQILSDDEIAAICAHEMAHLTEARKDYYQRYVLWLMFLPWLFFKPVVHLFGLFGYLVLVCSSAALPRLYRGISRKLESRADGMAKAAERDPGTYARALARLYEDNLMPAVTAKQTTHPHLYDRLVAAGVTPDFPRPAAAASTTWYGHILAGAMGLLAIGLVIRLTEQWHLFN